MVQKMSLSGMLRRVLERVEEMRAEAVAAAEREAALREHVAALDRDIANLLAEVERLQIIEAEVRLRPAPDLLSCDLLGQQVWVVGPDLIRNWGHLHLPPLTPSCIMPTQLC